MNHTKKSLWPLTASVASLALMLLALDTYLAVPQLYGHRLNEWELPGLHTVIIGFLLVALVVYFVVWVLIQIAPEYRVLLLHARGSRLPEFFYQNLPRNVLLTTTNHVAQARLLVRTQHPLAVFVEDACLGDGVDLLPDVEWLAHHASVMVITAGGSDQLDRWSQLPDVAVYEATDMTGLAATLRKLGASGVSLAVPQASQS